MYVKSKKEGEREQGTRGEPPFVRDPDQRIPGTTRNYTARNEQPTEFPPRKHWTELPVTEDKAGRAGEPATRSYPVIHGRVVVT